MHGRDCLKAETARINWHKINKSMKEWRIIIKRHVKVCIFFTTNSSWSMGNNLITVKDIWRFLFPFPH